LKHQYLQGFQAFFVTFLYQNVCLENP